jgi:hypothetical protein
LGKILEGVRRLRKRNRKEIEEDGAEEKKQNEALDILSIELRCKFKK